MGCNVQCIGTWSDMMVSKRIYFVLSKVLSQCNYLVLFIFRVISLPIVFTITIFYHSKAIVLLYNNSVSFEKTTPFFLKQLVLFGYKILSTNLYLTYMRCNTHKVKDTNTNTDTLTQQ